MRKLIFVAGMGRSGTSALTRVIALCGAGLPTRLHPPSAANVRGYWEAEEAIHLNDAFLEQQHSSWFDPTLALSSRRLPEDQVSTFQARISEFLRQGFGDAETVVLKEPRIYGVFEHWLGAARNAGFQIGVAHVFRHPDEVHASLHARDALSREHSLLLWLKYNLLVERHGRHATRVFVSYGQLTSDPVAAASKVAAALPGFGLKTDGEAGQAIESFISPDLHHQRAWRQSAIQDPTPSRWISRVYTALEQAESGWVDVKEFNDVLAEYGTYDALFRSAWTSFRRSPKPTGPAGPAER